MTYTRNYRTFVAVKVVKVCVKLWMYVVAISSMHTLFVFWNSLGLDDPRAHPRPFPQPSSPPAFKYKARVYGAILPRGMKIISVTVDCQYNKFNDCSEYLQNNEF